MQTTKVRIKRGLIVLWFSNFGLEAKTERITPHVCHRASSLKARHIGRTGHCPTYCQKGRMNILLGQNAQNSSKFLWAVSTKSSNCTQPTIQILRFPFLLLQPPKLLTYLKMENWKNGFTLSILGICHPVLAQRLAAPVPPPFGCKSVERGCSWNIMENTKIHWVTIWNHTTCLGKRHFRGPFVILGL